MKTLKFIALGFSLGISGLIAAQDEQPEPPQGSTTETVVKDSRNRLQIGIKGGINYSGVYDTKGNNFSSSGKFGGVGGGFLSIPIGTFLGIQPEVLYSQKGFSESGTTDEGNQYSVDVRRDFIDVPLLVQFKPVPDLYILGGPEYCFLLDRSYTFTNGVTSTTTQQQFNNDNLSKNIFGLIFGIDINIGLVTIGGRVAWDLQDNNGNGTSTFPRYRNAWGQATLGLRL